MKWLIENRGPNRHQRRAQYALPSASKPPRRRSDRAMREELRGRQLIEQFVMRGIVLTAPPKQRQKRNRMKPVAASVAHAVRFG